jgi:hypothetical protein
MRLRKGPKNTTPIATNPTPEQNKSFKKLPMPINYSKIHREKGFTTLQEMTILKVTNNITDSEEASQEEISVLEESIFKI